MFAGSYGGRAAHDGDQVGAAFHFNPEDGESVIVVMVGDALDKASEGFGHESSGELILSHEAVVRRMLFPTRARIASDRKQKSRRIGR